MQHPCIKSTLTFQSLVRGCLPLLLLLCCVPSLADEIALCDGDVFTLDGSNKVRCASPATGFWIQESEIVDYLNDSDIYVAICESYTFTSGEQFVCVGGGLISATMAEIQDSSYLSAHTDYKLFQCLDGNTWTQVVNGYINCHTQSFKAAVPLVDFANEYLDLGSSSSSSGGVGGGITANELRQVLVDLHYQDTVGRWAIFLTVLVGIGIPLWLCYVFNRLVSRSVD